jgi:predicted ATPase
MEERPTTVFISYRREDSAGHAGRLADTLRDELRRQDEVLRDVDELIAPGDDFRDAIRDAIDRSNVLVAVIGRRWLSCTDSAGRRRLDDEDDVVKLELLRALELGVPIVPVLVDGAEMPRPQELPPELGRLADRNALELSDTRWDADAGALIEALRHHAGERRPDVAEDLPHSPTGLVGRERELSEVSELLTGAPRLVTVTGPGGIGKTRFAIEAARTAASGYQRVLFCDLTPVDDARLVSAAIARAVGVDQPDDAELADALARSLNVFPTLLVIDNFEHVLEAGPALPALLSAAPRLDLLVTSRAALRVTGEREYPLPPLAEAPAVALFEDRARAVRPDLATEREAEAIGRICARLDGLPLAIELAAARVRLLSPAAMLEHLDRRLALLTHGAQDLPARQQTVRATIDWSYRLLAEPERELLARMSVFTGGATLPAIREVCGPERDELELLDNLQALAENSLVQTTTDQAGGERYRMLELIREFARERVREEGEDELLRRRHAEYYSGLAARLGPELEGPELIQAFRAFDAEYANLLEALAWAGEQPDPGAELELLGHLGEYWYFRGFYAESWPRLEHALGREDVPPARRAAVLRSAGSLRVRMGDTDEARRLFAESLAICEELGDAEGAARSLSGLEGCFASAEQYELAEEAGSRAIEIVRELGEERRLAFAVSNAGYTAMQRGDLTRARPFFDEANELGESLGDPEVLALAQQNLALLLVLADDDPERAAHLNASALAQAVELREHLGILAGLVTFAAISAHSGEPGTAARLLGLIDAELEIRDYVLDPVEAALRDRTAAEVEAALAAQEAAERRAEGAKLDLLETAGRLASG